MKPSAHDVCARLVSGGGAVEVADGWHMLLAQDKRPLFAWVEGKPVELWDKSSTPSLTMDVKTDEAWGASAVYGAGKDLAYRLTMTVPDTYALFSSYACAIHSEWDAHLALRQGSVRVELVSPGGTTADITDEASAQSNGAALDVRIADLCKTAAKPGDSIVLTYMLDADLDAAPGGAGFLNSAWATFPSFDGEGNTPTACVKAYAFKLHARAATQQGSPLAGATFAVCNDAGEWLTAEGAFGAEAARGTWRTDASGRVEIAPVLGRGSYSLLEIAAPEGYEPTSGSTVAAVDLSAEHDFDQLTLTCSASGAASVDEVDAQGGSATLLVEHRAHVARQDTPLDLIGKLPQTWDNLPPYAKFGFIALALGLLAILIGHLANKGDEREGAGES